jgi:hypothetical protein
VVEKAQGRTRNSSLWEKATPANDQGFPRLEIVKSANVRPRCRHRGPPICGAAMTESSDKTDTNAGNFGWFGINIFYRVKDTGQPIGIARLAFCRSLLAEHQGRRWKASPQQVQKAVRFGG